MHRWKFVQMAGLTAALAVFMVALAACGNDDNGNPTTPTSMPDPTTAPTEVPMDDDGAENGDEHGHSTEEPTGELGTDTGAADLRALLTAQLQEHVYLAGMATGEALVGREASFEAAAGALDANSIALSESIGLVYGDEAGTAFLELWRTHIGFFVDYTVGRATGDEAMVQQAADDLDAYRMDFGAFIASANPNLPAEAVADELVHHVETLFAAIDAQAAGDTNSFMLLREAADHMPGTAAVLTSGIVTQFPETFDGDPDGTGAGLRALLTAQLQEHVYLAAIATGEALGGREANFEAAAGALDANSIALSESIGLVYGDEAGTAFLELWRTHIGFFVDYTVGRATGDEAMVQQAAADLDAYRTDFGAYIASANPNLPAEAVADELVHHVETLFAVIDAQAAGDPGSFMLLLDAAAHMPGTAAVLASGIAQQFPDQFGS